MSADEVELMYVFLKEVQDEERAWFERVMGITWTYDQAMSMMSKPVAEGEEPKEQKPTLLGPGGKVHYPLSMALNGAMLKEVTGRFQRDASSMLTPDGELIQGENMFSWKKEDFLRQMGHGHQVQEPTEGFDSKSPQHVSRSISMDTPLPGIKAKPVSKRHRT